MKRALERLVPPLLLLACLPLLGGNMPPPPLERYQVVTELAVGGTRICHPDFSATWSDLVPMAGFTPLEVSDPAAWLAEKGKLVSFRALATRRSRVAVFLGADACAPEQRRSDQRDSPDGSRLFRDGLTVDAPSLVATELRPFDALELRRVDDRLEVTLGTGGLAPHIDDLQIVVHYEGCGKKPLSYERASERFAITEDAPRSERFPLLVQHERGVARAHSVQVRGGEPVRFLVDRALSRNGIDVACP
jgi:hypothetical protein